MKRIIPCAALLLVVFTLSACKPQPTAPQAVVAQPVAPQPVVPYKDLEWKDETYYLNGQPFNGVAQDKHANGRLHSEYPMKNGKPHGLVREWYENGQLSTETHFENGQRHGSNRYWNNEGRLLKEQMYDHDKSISEKLYPTPAADKKDP